MNDHESQALARPEALTACLDHLRAEAVEAGYVEAGLFLDLAILSIRRDQRALVRRMSN